MSIGTISDESFIFATQLTNNENLQTYSLVYTCINFLNRVGLLGVYLVIIEVIDFIRNVRTYPDLMDMVVIFFLGGVTFIISAILQWHKKKAVRIAANIYLRDIAPCPYLKWHSLGLASVFPSCALSVL